MSDLIEQLVALLELERLEQNLFRGESRNIVGPRVFGGQVLGQALVAAGRTVKAGRSPHSLHSYFLRAGDADAPVIYEVERVRDGGSFSTRRVVAIQHGRPIFTLSSSFQRSEDGLEHQDEMPEVAGPEQLEAEWDVLARCADRMPEGFGAVVEALRPIEIRPVEAEDPLHPQPRPARRMAWLRVAGGLPEDDLLHYGLLAYASDFRLLGTALLPHGRSLFQGRTQLTSLDHAMWFHRPVRVNQWLLYTMDSPCAVGGRGLARGQIFAADGTLLASVCQEGLIRSLMKDSDGRYIRESAPQGS